jgi:hypothetical protein
VISDAPEPEGIKWENLEKSSYSLLFRKFLSTILTIMLLLACFLIFIYIDIKQEEKLIAYPYIQCN